VACGDGCPDERGHLDDILDCLSAESLCIHPPREPAVVMPRASPEDMTLGRFRYQGYDRPHQWAATRHRSHRAGIGCLAVYLLRDNVSAHIVRDQTLGEILPLCEGKGLEKIPFGSKASKIDGLVDSGSVTIN
jgi:hypothetical protein